MFVVAKSERVFQVLEPFYSEIKRRTIVFDNLFSLLILYWFVVILVWYCLYFIQQGEIIHIYFTLFSYLEYCSHQTQARILFVV